MLKYLIKHLIKYSIKYSIKIDYIWKKQLIKIDSIWKKQFVKFISIIIYSNNFFLCLFVSIFNSINSFYYIFSSSSKRLSKSINLFIIYIIFDLLKLFDSFNQNKFFLFYFFRFRVYFSFVFFVRLKFLTD